MNPDTQSTSSGARTLGRSTTSSAEADAITAPRTNGMVVMILTFSTATGC